MEDAVFSYRESTETLWTTHRRSLSFVGCVLVGVAFYALSAFLALDGVPELVHIRLRRATTCNRSVIHSLSEYPCYQDQQLAKQCFSATHAKFLPSYMLEAEQRPMTKKQLANDTIFGFLHVNKAGGTTIKREIIYPFLQSTQSDGAAFGVPHSWHGLGEPWSLATSRGGGHGQDVLTAKRRTFQDPRYVQCGAPVMVDKTLAPFKDMSKCQFRAFWGSRALGVCDHFPGRPCMYFTVLRNPVERLFSQFNYLCSVGKPQAPKWKEDLTCSGGILNFLRSNGTSTDFLVNRLSGGCNADVAIANLKSPCMRYVFLDDLRHGATQLADQLGPAMDPVWKRLARTNTDRNRTPYHPATRKMLKDKRLMEIIEKELADDLRVYNEAKAYYDEQWKEGPRSCSRVGM